mmetsp:Transcript_29111/g.79910  ORF Transcript_29111/g.79910 Transcript_29111/m.79910 type:complete len:551 (-) Transcript_29111:1477-3129(-)
MYFSYETMRWEKGPRPATEGSTNLNTSKSSEAKAISEAPPQSEDENGELYFSYDTMKWETRTAKAEDLEDKAATPGDNDEQGELSFDDVEMKCKAPGKLTSSTGEGEGADVGSEQNHEQLVDEKDKPDETSKSSVDDRDDVKGADDVFGEDFDLFYSELQREIDESGSAMGKIDKEEARDFFSSAKAVTAAKHDSEPTEMTFHDSDRAYTGSDQLSAVANSPGSILAPSESGQTSVGTIELEPEQHFDELITGTESKLSPTNPGILPDVDEGLASDDGLFDAAAEASGVKDSAPNLIGDKKHKYDNDLEELREILPMLPEQRLKSILKVFYKELETPSMIDLVLVLREIMPDYLTNTWLKKMSKLTAEYVMADADKKGLVGLPFLNAVLELKASLGNLDDATRFYSEFKARNIEPSDYTDRLMIQMFLKQKRFGRAIKFKQRLQSQSRMIDLLTYGSLIEYCAKRDQLGSSLLLLKECIKVHGAPPGEATLRKMRVLLRRHRIDDDPEIFAMIGEDPLSWLHRGQAALKREKSKRGNRDVRLPRSRLLKA